MRQILLSDLQQAGNSSEASLSHSSDSEDEVDAGTEAHGHSEASSLGCSLVPFNLLGQYLNNQGSMTSPPLCRSPTLH